LDGKRRADIEDEARKKDAKRQRLMKEFMLPQYVMQIHKQTDPHAQVARPRLSLPAPQISDSDLQEIAKINAAGGAAAAAGGSTPTRALLASYGATPVTGAGSGSGAFGGVTTGVFGAVGRTPMLALPTPQRTASTGDALLAEARAQMAMTQRSSALAGGAMPAMDYTPRTAAGAGGAKTPGGMGGAGAGATPRLTGVGATPRMGTGLVGSTPQFASTPATPSDFDDGFESGSSSGMSKGGSGSGSAGAGALALKRRQAAVKSALQSGLSALPQPRNEAVLAAPMAVDDDEEDEDSEAKSGKAKAKAKASVGGTVAFEEDAADAQQRRRAAEAEAEEARLKRRSQVLQRDLPRPHFQLASGATLPARPLLPSKSSGNAGGESADSASVTDAQRHAAAALVTAEMLRLLPRDAAQHPQAGASSRPHAALLTGAWDAFADHELAAARGAISRELTGLLASAPAGYSVPRAHAAAAASVEADLLYSAARQTWVSAAQLSAAERHACLRGEWAALVDQARAQQRANQKTEARLQTLMQGYAVRAAGACERLERAYVQLDEAVIQRESFGLLLEQEGGACVRRVNALRRDVAAAKEVEVELQERYARLLREHEEASRQHVMLQQQQQLLLQAGGGAASIVADAASAMRASFVPAVSAT
jgi:pre-mRNA-splicing factor CDC5/CEF1